MKSFKVSNNRNEKLEQQQQKSVNKLQTKEDICWWWLSWQLVFNYSYLLIATHYHCIHINNRGDWSSAFIIFTQHQNMIHDCNGQTLMMMQKRELLHCCWCGWHNEDMLVQCIVSWPHPTILVSEMSSVIVSYLWTILLNWTTVGNTNKINNNHHPTFNYPSIKLGDNTIDMYQPDVSIIWIWTKNHNHNQSQGKLVSTSCFDQYFLWKLTHNQKN